jgi:flagellar motor switch protein FliN/FliY
MAHEFPLAWARRIDAALCQVDRIPLFGNAPPFDMHRISSLIAEHFGSPSLSVEIGDRSWCEESEIKEGLGSNVVSLGISATPLAGEAVWLMGREDIAHLTSFLMSGKTRGRPSGSEILQEGFYRYLALEALDALHEVEPLKNFSLKISDEGGAIEKQAYCIDVKLSFEKRSCWGCLALSPRFLTSWQRHFASLRELFCVSSLAQGVDVLLSICTGSFTMTAKEWNGLEPGDFVILDRSSYDSRHREGSAELMLGSTTLMHVSVKENRVKWLDYALSHEETMKKSELPENNESAPSSLAEEERAMAIKELPLHITVELARIRMTVDQLMKLSPGNFLELPIRPDQEVALTVNGQKIGRGEIVYLGEVPGIRILETV